MHKQAAEYNTPEASNHPSDLREHSLRLLEFHLVREEMASYTTFSPARDLALELVPSYELAQVVHRQRETSEARDFLERGSTIDLSGARDLRQALERAALGGILTGEELCDLHDTLRACRDARAEILRQKEMPILQSMAQNLPALRDLEVELAAAIGRSGEVLDGASPTLGELCSESRLAYQRLIDALERTVRRMSRHDILQEPIITQRNGRMVLLVKTEMKHRLQGIVHDVSDSGATIFVEPVAAVGLGNRWRELRLAEEREEERVLRSLSVRVEAHSDDLTLGLDLLAQLDLAFAKARYSRATNAIAPNLIEGEHQYIWLVDARHPLLEGEVVPITVKLGDRWSLLLITGPNAGGKTVALKTAGLLTLMGQAGLHLPVKEGTLSLFDGVYADIGDQQSIQHSLSTFSSHIVGLRAIMEQATARSLVLIDELGTSTDPEEGAALAKAILGEFQRRGITLLATTHQRDVVAFVHQQPGMLNASVELDPRTLAPTYRLPLGLPGRSYAFTIASRLGLENSVVEDARSRLPSAQRGAESLLNELQQERHLAEEARREAEEVLAQSQRKSAELDERLAAFQDRSAEMVEEARYQLQLRVDELAKHLRGTERVLEQRVHRPAVEEPQVERPVSLPSVEEAREAVDQVRRELRSPEWQPPPSRRGDWLKGLQMGDRVYLKGIPRAVEVITPPGGDGSVEVLIGTMRARLPAYQLDRPARENTTPSREGIFYVTSGKRKADTELDLHGARVEEALDRLESFLNDAILAGLSSVRVIHGVGTGALRNAIREHLSHHPLVKASGRDDNITSDGVTVVELT